MCGQRAMGGNISRGASVGRACAGQHHLGTWAVHSGTPEAARRYIVHEATEICPVLLSAHTDVSRMWCVRPRPACSTAHLQVHLRNSSLFRYRANQLLHLNVCQFRQGPVGRASYRDGLCSAAQHAGAQTRMRTYHALRVWTYLLKAQICNGVRVIELLLRLCTQAMLLKPYNIRTHSCLRARHHNDVTAKVNHTFNIWSSVAVRPGLGRS